LSRNVITEKFFDVSMVSHAAKITWTVVFTIPSGLS